MRVPATIRSWRRPSNKPIRNLCAVAKRPNACAVYSVDPSRSFTDELIAERRAAARAETQAEAETRSARR